MDPEELTPSPLAGTLLHLAARRADGSIEIGGRTLSVSAGALLRVDAAPEDRSFAAFLVAAGRLDEGRAAELEGSEDEPGLERLREALGVDGPGLRELLRSLYLDRLVAGFEREEAEGARAPTLREAETVSGDVESFPLVPLVLDALTRLAAFGDAGRVGARADHDVVLLEGPHRTEASTWSGIDTEGGRVSRFLMRDPLAAPRLAALVRAHLARLVAPRSSSAGGHEGEPGRSSLSPPRPPRLSLGPGHAPEMSLPEPVAPRLPEAKAPLTDPLEALEERARSLDAEGGEAAAELWRDVARGWQRHFGAIGEAARAYREATAANPRDHYSSGQAASLCAALGQEELATAYARSAAAIPDPGRAQRLTTLARLQVLAGDTEAALASLERASRLEPDSTETTLMAANLLERSGRVEEAAARLRDAARALLPTAPRRARALLDLALSMAPTGHQELRLLARRLVADGEPRAAIERVRQAAAEAPAAERLGLLHDAAETAESVGEFRLAADLLLAALAAQPEAEVLYAPLAEDLSRCATPAVQAAGLEVIASVAPAGERATWWLRAAHAWSEAGDAEALQHELLALALEDRPGDPEVLAALRVESEASRDYGRFADALERAVRRGAASPQGVVACLRELAELARVRLGSTALELWALERLDELTEGDDGLQARLERLRTRDRVSEGMIRLAEEELAGADLDQRQAAARRLAGLAFDRPARREQARRLYEEVVHLDPADHRAASRLQRLWALTDDADGLCRALRERVRAAPTREERLHAALMLSLRRGAAADPSGACVAALEALELSPGDERARARVDVTAPLIDGPLLRLRALRALAAHATDDGDRARALAQLAWEETGADRRLDCALEALRLDPDQARAAGALAERATRGEARVLPLASPILSALGDPPALRRRLAELARAEGDAALEEQLLGGLLRLSVSPPSAAVMRLDAARRAKRLEHVASLVEDAIRADGSDPRTAELVHRALAELAGEAPAEVCGVALRAADSCGARGGALLDLAEETARVTGDLTMQLAVAERRAGRATGGERGEALRAVASIHRARGDRAGEVRAWVRLLGALPFDREALTRLTTLYAEGDRPAKLRAVLELRCERAQEPAERRERLLDLAEAISRQGGTEQELRDVLIEAERLGADGAASPGDVAATGDPREAVERLVNLAQGAQAPEAEAHLCRAVLMAEQQCKDPSLALRVAEDGLERWPGSGSLLVLFERLALQLADVASAKRVYRSLDERSMGRHGRRALAYRRARWFERAGASEEALEAYAQAFRLAPSDGVVFRGLERLARERDEPAALAEALSMLADRCREVERHLELATRSARLSADALGDPVAAFRRLHVSWVKTGSAGLLPPLRDLAKRCQTLDPATADRARRELLEGLRKRVEQSWDDADKVRTLLEMAAIAGDDGADHRAALAASEEAVRVARASEEVDPALRTAAEMDLARRAPAGSTATEAHRADDEQADDQQADDQQADDQQAEVEQAEVEQAEVEQAEVEQADDQQADDQQADDQQADDQQADDQQADDQQADDQQADDQEAEAERADDEQAGALDTVGVQPTATAPQAARGNPYERGDARANRPSAGAAGGGNLRAATTSSEFGGWFSAPRPVARRPHAATQRPTDPLMTKVAAFRADPTRLEELESLASEAEARGLRALAHVARELLACVEPSQAPAAELRPADHLVDALGLVAEAPEVHGPLLRGLWEGALPLFRRPLRSFGVLGTQRVTPLAARPLGAALAEGLRLLGPLEVTLYARPSSRREVVIAPTHPPAVLVADTLEDDSSELRFRLGAALDSARPEAVILAISPPETGRMILEAAFAAFGPAGDQAPAKDAAALAADLWRTVPSRQQAELRRAVAAVGGAPDYDLARRQWTARGARAGLLLSGSLRATLCALPYFDDEVAGLGLDSAEDYRQLVSRSEAARSVIAMAFSDRWLSAVDRALDA